MAYSRALGKNFGVDGEKIFFYNAEGIRLTTGECLSRETILRECHGWREEQEAAKVLPMIRAMIRQVVADGKSTEIAGIQVKPRFAVQLFLDGTLTRKHLEKARVLIRYIEIPDVNLMRGFTLPLRVMESEQLDYNIAVVNARNKVLRTSTRPMR